MKEQEFNLTYEKLAEVVGKSPAGIEQVIRKTINEWHEAGICPKIYKGEVKCRS